MKVGIHMNLEQFREEINSKDIVLVDFYTDDCQPCKMMKPIVESIEEEFPVIYVNVNESKDIADYYKVMGVPLIVVFNGGSEFEKYKGFAPRELIMEMLHSAEFQNNLKS